MSGGAQSEVNLRKGSGDQGRGDEMSAAPSEVNLRKGSGDQGRGDEMSSARSEVNLRRGICDQGRGGDQAQPAFLHLFHRLLPLFSCRHSPPVVLHSRLKLSFLSSNLEMSRALSEVNLRPRRGSGDQGREDEMSSVRSEVNLSRVSGDQGQGGDEMSSARSEVNLRRGSGGHGIGGDEMSSARSKVNLRRGSGGHGIGGGESESSSTNNSNDRPELPATTSAAPINVGDDTSFVSEGVVPVILEEPWCQFLSEYPEIPSIPICNSIIFVGSDDQLGIQTSDKPLLYIICLISLFTKRDEKPNVVLSTKNEGFVLLNGKETEENSSYNLNSGDELIFGFHYNPHDAAYIFQQLPNEHVGKSIPVEHTETRLYKVDIVALIVDGQLLEVSFGNFPYYLSDKTKSKLVAATYVHMKHKDQVKYTIQLPNLNPRILLSGPKGSDIYQEMLVKALARYYGAKLLIFENDSFFRGRPENTQLLDDVAQNVCSTSKPFPPFKFGDRVEFVGQPSDNLYPGSGRMIRNPAFRLRGTVLLPFEDNPLSKVGVSFDESVLDGLNLGGLCHDGHGFFCNADDLKWATSSSVAEDYSELIEAIFEIVFDESRNSPFILFVKDVEKAVVETLASYVIFEEKMERIPDGSIIIGSHMHTTNEDKGVDTSPTNIGITWMGRYLAKKYAFDSRGMSDLDQKRKLLSMLFPNEVIIDVPEHQLVKDVEILKIKANLNHLQRALSQSQLECDGIEKMSIKDQILTNESAKEVVGLALTHHLMQEAVAISHSRLVLSTESIEYGIQQWNALYGSKKTERPSYFI